SGTPHAPLRWAHVAGSGFPGNGPGIAPPSAWQPFWSRSRHLLPDHVRLSFAPRTRTATSEAAVVQILPVDGAGCSRTVSHVLCPGDAVVQPLLPGALVITQPLSHSSSRSVPVVFSTSPMSDWSWNQRASSTDMFVHPLEVSALPIRPFHGAAC